MENTGYSFTVLYEPAEEGGYVVTCPAIPGLVTEGETLEHAREMARDAIRAYLDSLPALTPPSGNQEPVAALPAKGSA